MISSVQAKVVRAAQLSKPKHSSGLQREIGTVQLAPVRQIALTEMFDRLITGKRVRITKDGKEDVRIDCPSKIAAAYLSRTSAPACLSQRRRPGNG